LPGFLTQYFDFHLSLIITPIVHNNKADSVSQFEKQTTMAFVQSYIPVLKGKKTQSFFGLKPVNMLRQALLQDSPN